MSEGFFYRRIGRPILDLLRQGATPEKLALSLSLGAALGVFPVLGATTALCAVAALVLRINLPAIQIANYLVYPAQIALLIPFFRFGEWIFRAPRLPLSVSQVVSIVRANYWQAIRLLWTTTWHAVIAWSVVAPVLIAVLYGILLLILKSVLRKGVPPEH
ncbi:MAG TPA: DUF2062 domain-containing protein [Candidatus Methylomirabilis sp.]|nr:DUF2062 domain-containing protein [Candidatus Methylomirabilis sp.]